MSEGMIETIRGPSSVGAGRRWCPPVAFGAAALLVGVGACQTGQAEDGPTVQSAQAEIRDLRIQVEATGLIEPIRTVEVKSKASGEILALHVDTGDRVDPGTLLAEVDPRDVRNAFDQAEADLNVAQARRDIASAQLGRAKEMVESGVITEQEYETRVLDFANAEAQLVKAQTNRDLAELRLQDVTIRAPMAGTIITKSVEEGQVIQSASGNVSGGTTLFLMAALGEVQVRTLVDETDFGHIQPGMEAQVVVEAYPERTFRGKVEKIEPQAEVQQNITMFPVIVKLDNSEGLLRPGMNAEVEMLVAERGEVVTVPNNAVVKLQDMAPAAAVLGLETEGIEFERSVYDDLRVRLRGDTPPTGDDAPAAAEGGTSPGSSAEGGAGQRSGRSGGGFDPSVGGSRFGGAAGGRPGSRGGGGSSGGGVRTDPGSGEAGVVFVVRPDGRIEPRPVLLGLNDWDYTEILLGLEPGEQVAQIGIAQLQAEREAQLQRFRNRSGGIPGLGGGGGGPRGGFGR